MSSLDALHDAFTALTEGWAEGRIAHGYLVAGSPRGDGGVLAKSLAQWLLCAAGEGARPCGVCRSCRLVEEKTHPDVFWLEPESKSRIIRAEPMRELIRSLGQSSYEGGWKVAVILEADRMNEASANAFLKTLEEPAPRTVLLLVTESPQALLPTIASRCQRIALSAEGDGEAPAWRAALVEVLSAPADSAPHRMRRAGAFKALLDEAAREEAAAEKQDEESSEADKEVRDARIRARVLRTRTAMLRMTELWYRDIAACAAGAEKKVLHFPEEADTLMLRANTVGLDRALAMVGDVEAMTRGLERAMVELSVFETRLP